MMHYWDNRSAPRQTAIGRRCVYCLLREYEAQGVPCQRTPLIGDHYCGDFPGASGHPLRNTVSIYWNDWRAVPGYYWSNLKEGNGHNYGGPFNTAWHCYEDAQSHYPDMRKSEAYAWFRKHKPQEGTFMPASRFDYVEYSPAARALNDEITERAKALEESINKVTNREMSLALTHLETTVMWARKGLRDL